MNIEFAKQNRKSSWGEKVLDDEGASLFLKDVKPVSEDNPNEQILLNVGERAKRNYEKSRRRKNEKLECFSYVDHVLMPIKEKALTEFEKEVLIGGRNILSYKEFFETFSYEFEKCSGFSASFFDNKDPSSSFAGWVELQRSVNSEALYNFGFSNFIRVNCVDAVDLRGFVEKLFIFKRSSIIMRNSSKRYNLLNDVYMLCKKRSVFTEMKKIFQSVRDTGKFGFMELYLNLNDDVLSTCWGNFFFHCGIKTRYFEFNQKTLYCVKDIKNVIERDVLLVLVRICIGNMNVTEILKEIGEGDVHKQFVVTYDGHLFYEMEMTGTKGLGILSNRMLFN